MAQVIAQLIVVFGVLAVITYVLIKVAVGPPTIGKREQLRRYWKVEIGMSEYEMLDIMGDGYNRSLLQNNRVKYEWRIQASSIGYYYKGLGVSTRSYSGVRKVDIYVKDGYVEEVRPYNV